MRSTNRQRQEKKCGSTRKSKELQISAYSEPQRPAVRCSYAGRIGPWPASLPCGERRFFIEVRLSPLTSLHHPPHTRLPALPCYILYAFLCIEPDLIVNDKPNSCGHAGTIVSVWRCFDQLDILSYMIMCRAHSMALKQLLSHFD